MKKLQKLKVLREFTVKILAADCNLLFLNRKEADLVHNAVVYQCLSDVAEKDYIKNYKKLAKKLEKQIGL